ncbi:hypothetical protein QBC45DRAFT_388364 [Copromyces sp. CBS 386.78]|nr:hypothetical protein QBC45DRAFT_388364 [Copromyces sp. CBS 386.78]
MTEYWRDNGMKAGSEREKEYSELWSRLRKATEELRTEVDKAILNGPATSLKDLEVHRKLWKVREALYAIEQYDHGLQGKGIGLYKLPDDFCYKINGVYVAYPTMEQLDAYDLLVEHTMFEATFS